LPLLKFQPSYLHVLHEIRNRSLTVPVVEDAVEACSQGAVISRILPKKWAVLDSGCIARIRTEVIIKS